MKTAVFSLDDKYLKEEGRVVLSGLQALVRIPLDQHRADRRAGLKTATLISGYRGSPLGALDLLLQRHRKLLEEHSVLFLPGVNEDLGATAIFGSQLANLMPEPRYDGVLGLWYGKGPGVDRSGDAFKHANFGGVGRYGGVLAVAGDDPLAKSSTLPTHSEVALYDARMPILFPGNVQEIISFGRYGLELSRYCGSWVGFKVVTDIADSFASAEVTPLDLDRPPFEFEGRPWQHRQISDTFVPFSLQMEEEIETGRLQAATEFCAFHGLNRLTATSSSDRIGLVAAGKTYYDLREALLRLGIDDKSLQDLGIRLLKLGMIYPLETNSLNLFARGLEEIIVVEEKRAFIELFVRDLLFNVPHRPQIIGKKDQTGCPFIPSYGELDAESLALLLGRRLSSLLPDSPVPRRLAELEGLLSASSDAAALPTEPPRTPYFCSGCPHNRSTRVPEGSVAAGGIGCHAMAIRMDRHNQGITHMGGEGAQWVGAAPFTGSSHIFQNLGDGTLFHSGQLAIRQAVAAGTNITYKILYNSAVAMTGGQPVDGGLPVPALTRALEAEGVARTIVCTSNLGQYGSGARWAKEVEIWDRGRLDEAQRVLRDTRGVTVLIYDQPCAAELRRKRKRGLAPIPQRKVFIHEEVCEGCGDCGEKSNCLSVFPVETEFGRKTRIDQSSCNLDYTCLEGDCPAFVTVKSNGRGAGSKPSPLSLPDLERTIPDPEPKVPSGDVHLYLTGIGGTGVVTVTQVLSTAAFLEGKHVQSLDQTGLSQMGGPVVSHIKISDQILETSSKIGPGDADAYIVFDVLTGSVPHNLARAHSEKTVAVVSFSNVPTGDMVHSTDIAFPEWSCLRERIETVTRREENVYLDARTQATTLFGSHMPANLITLGAAYQAGVIPISQESISRAIELNGVAVDASRQAFQVGRLIVAAPEALHLEKAEPEQGGEKALDIDVSRLLDELEVTGAVRRLLEVRVPELAAYQNLAYARQYADFVGKVARREQDLGGDSTPLSEAVARFLFKLMAYKDEYEVARLFRKPSFRKALGDAFGETSRIQYLLHPPLLRSLGLSRKIRLGRWASPLFWLLHRLRVVRGTPLDLFGYTSMRRMERQLIDEYRTLIDAELDGLSRETLDRAVRVARLPDVIRGYEQIKLDNIRHFREMARRLTLPSGQVSEDQLPSR